MNWEPIITAWIIFFVIAIVGIFGIQIASKVPKHFRSVAQIFFVILCILICVFAALAEYFRISIWFAIPFVLIVYLLALAVFVMIRSIFKEKDHLL